MAVALEKIRGLAPLDDVCMSVKERVTYTSCDC